MKLQIQQLLRKFSILLETFIAGLLCIAIVYFTFRLLGSTLRLDGFPLYDSFEDLLSVAFSLVIGIEMIRMMCEHSAENIFEVLAFAIARQIVIDHTYAIDNLYGIAAIAILFLIRKYLFYGRNDHTEEHTEPSDSHHEEESSIS